MSGASLAVGAMVITSVCAVGMASVGAASVWSARASGAADAAALAAADAASGAATGVPCDRAAEVAGAVGAIIVACDLDGTNATIRVRIGAGLLAAEARARAGTDGTALTASS